MIDRTTPIDQLPANLRTRELAEWLGVGDASVRKEIADGRLRATRIGRLIRVSRDDLVSWLHRNNGNGNGNSA